MRRKIISFRYSHYVGSLRLKQPWDPTNSEWIRANCRNILNCEKQFVNYLCELNYEREYLCENVQLRRKKKLINRKNINYNQIKLLLKLSRARNIKCQTISPDKFLLHWTLYSNTKLLCLGISNLKSSNENYNLIVILMINTILFL